MDEWVVIAQQRDETAAAFTERVNQRARRLTREDARLESIDVYAAPHAAGESRSHSAIEALGARLADGGRLTLWSSDRRGDDQELAAILAHLRPLLAKRQIAVNQQNCDAEERSGVRHVAPLRPTELTDEFDFEALG